MTAFDHTTYIAAPAIVTFNGATYHTKDDITVKVNKETWAVATSRHGRIDDRIKSVSGDVSFTPCGMVSDLDKTYPYAATDLGKSIFAATDKPLTIWSIDDSKYIFQRAAITGVPNLKLSANATAFAGALQFLCLHKRNTAPTVADSFVAITSASFSDATFDETEILSPGYTAAWGAIFSGVESEDGFDISFALDIKRDSVDRHGIVSARLNSIDATATFKPVGITEANYLKFLELQDSIALLPGQSVAKTGNDLVITASDASLAFTLYKAGVSAGGAAFGQASRLGDLTFRARRSWTAGVADPLYAFNPT